MIWKQKIFNERVKSWFYNFTHWLDSHLHKIMDTIVKYSVLNPLATCFVPSKFRVDCENREKSRASTNKTNDEDQPSDNLTDPAPIFEKSPRLPSPADNEDKKLKLKTAEESLNCNNVEIMAFLKFLLIIILKFCIKRDYSTGLKNDTCETRIDKIVENEDCDCPPMFGYVIPHDFFGNPFNMSPCCNKKCVHIRHYTDCSFNKKRRSTYPAVREAKVQRLEKRVKCDYPQKINSSMNAIECDNEVGSPKLINKGDRLSRIVGSGRPRSSSETSEYDSFEIEEMETCSLLDTLNKIGMANDAPMIIDDNDDHPLLERTFGLDDDEGFCSFDSFSDVENTRKIECRLPLSIEMSRTVCNPPCSVWCTAYLRSNENGLSYFQKNGPHSYLENTERIALLQKTFYKRHLTNLCSKQTENLKSIQSSLYEPKKLSNTTNFTNVSEYHIKNMNATTCESLRGNLQVDKLNQRVNTNWGPFDGIDSLWKPLPDCTTSSTMKQNIHKRIKELKRQR